MAPMRSSGKTLSRIGAVAFSIALLLPSVSAFLVEIALLLPSVSAFLRASESRGNGVVLAFFRVASSIEADANSR